VTSDPSAPSAILAAGVDGCRAGWIGAGRRRDGNIDVRVFASFSGLISTWPDAPIAIDIPIGLAVCGPRSSDRMVRTQLGPRRASVFPPPPRAALRARSYAEACELRRQVEGKAVSAQAWGIFAKIAEVDAQMSPELQALVIESHPELCFTMMNRGVPARSGKKTAGGRQERLDLLAGSLPGATHPIASPKPRGSAPDDLLDALAVLWTAERYLRNEARVFPYVPERDERGLRMEIWY
jgi:predicted RNase H-like nuclease